MFFLAMNLQSKVMRKDDLNHDASAPMMMMRVPAHSHSHTRRSTGVIILFNLSNIMSEAISSTERRRRDQRPHRFLAAVAKYYFSTVVSLCLLHENFLGAPDHIYYVCVEKNSAHVQKVDLTACCWAYIPLSSRSSQLPDSLILLGEMFRGS